VDPGRAAPDVTPQLAARTLIASLVGVPAMLVAATVLVLWLVHEGVDAHRAASWLVVVVIAELAVGIAAWCGLRRPVGRRMPTIDAVAAGSGTVMLMCALTSVWMPSPANRPDIEFVYQLWICGTAAVMMAIAGAMTRVFLAGPAAMIAVNTLLLASGLAGPPRVLAVFSALYVVVLLLCQLGQRSAMRSAVTNEHRAHHLLDELAGANQLLAFEATHDLLTCIANRRRIISELATELTGVGPDRAIDVMFLDLDGFKEVNDTFGHAVGDELLVAAATRITALVGDEDLVGRQGGDEFIVLLRGRSPDEARAIADQVRVALETSFRLGEHLVSVSASIGLVRCDRADVAADDVLREADVALYRAKELGRNCVVVHRGARSYRVEGSGRSAVDLRAALQTQAIRAHYQPIVDMETGGIVGAEALARWVQPDGRVLAPAAFLRALTEAGLDTDLGIHMALQIMSFRCGIAELVPETFRVGLNVTLRRTRAKDLVDSLAAMQPMLTPTGASVIEGMTIELTENVAVRDLDEMEVELARARSLGLAVALDDFGTGHSSLTLVRRLPLDTIKIDRCFVDGIATDRASQAVVAAVVELATGVGASVVAEGVEQMDDALQLRSLGCRLAQGFLYAPAVPAETLRDWLEHGPPWQQPRRERVGVPIGGTVRQDVRPH
jgi:diguanylate cyclase (GGDEF)-like protein